MTPAAGEGTGGDGDGERSADGRTFIERARRAQIIEATIAVIASRGYGSASFARIAERAGISPALISYHFGSKDALLRAVVTHVDADIDQTLTDATAHVDGYRAGLRTLIETQVRYFAEHVEELLAIGQILTHGRERLGDLEATLRRSGLEEIEAMLRSGQEHGEFASFATRPMAVTLYAALEAVPEEVLADEAFDATAYGRELADLFDIATSTPRR